MKQAACRRLERVINRYLALDEVTLERLKPLAGKVLSFHIKRPQVTLYFVFQTASIQLHDQYEGPVDTEIHASLFQLLKMKHGSTGVHRDFFVTGDVAVAAVLKTILQQHDIDWEEHFSQIVGDVLAHKFGQVVTRKKRFFRQAAGGLRQNVTEFLQEESETLPPRQMLEDFYQAVDDVSADVARLQARIQLMKVSCESD